MENVRAIISEASVKWFGEFYFFYFNFSSVNPHRAPLLVIDFMSTLEVTSNRIEDFCGGRHHTNLMPLEKLLIGLQNLGCRLVFFVDLTYDETKIKEKLMRSNKRQRSYNKFYDAIYQQQTLRKIASSCYGAITSTLAGRLELARKYGQVINATVKECDFLLAQYATHHNAMAVVSNDSDFLIFRGPWRFWNASRLRSRKKKFFADEYSRDLIPSTFSLTMDKMPLFATLLGNDITKYKAQLATFVRRSGTEKFTAIANYVRQIDCTQLTDDDFARITMDFCRCENEEFLALIKTSIESYDIDVAVPVTDDLIARSLEGTVLLRPYIKNMKKIHGNSIPFYDLRGGVSATNLPQMLIDWKRRSSGFLRQRFNDDSFTLVLMAKLTAEENFSEYVEKPIYPDCKWNHHSRRSTLRGCEQMTSCLFSIAIKSWPIPFPI